MMESKNFVRQSNITFYQKINISSNNNIIKYIISIYDQTWY